MLLFHLHTRHHIAFSLFCCQGDAKTSALPKQLNNQEEKPQQPIGEFESVSSPGGRGSLTVPCVPTWGRGERPQKTEKEM